MTAQSPRANTGRATHKSHEFQTITNLLAVILAIVITALNSQKLHTANIGMVPSDDLCAFSTHREAL
ncbi:hypothetical protein MYIN104542_07565 [Mycobacterium intermedium]